MSRELYLTARTTEGHHYVGCVKAAAATIATAVPLKEWQAMSKSRRKEVLVPLCAAMFVQLKFTSDEALAVAEVVDGVYNGIQIPEVPHVEFIPVGIIALERKNLSR